MRDASYASANSKGTCRPSVRMTCSLISTEGASARETSTSLTVITAVGGNAMRSRYVTEPVTWLVAGLMVGLVVAPAGPRYDLRVGAAGKQQHEAQQATRQGF